MLVNSKSKIHVNTIFFGFSKAHHTFLFFLANKVQFESFYRGQDCIEKLINCLRKWLGWSESQQQNYRKLSSVMSWSERQQLLSTENPICCLWWEHVSHKKELVIHHCHYSGQVYGIAHSRCNLKARRSNFLPVFFHNLPRYDAHHIFKNLQLAANEKLSAISRTDETYTSFSMRLLYTFLNALGTLFDSTVEFYAVKFRSQAHHLF